MAKQKSKQVLSDHLKTGSRFVPPLLQLGTFHDARWRQSIVPELLWLALLNERHGQRRSAELAVAVAKAAAETSGSTRFFGLTSSFAPLTDQEKSGIRNRLRLSRDLDETADGLLPLLVFYPGCPLCFLYDGAIPALDHPQAGLPRFKKLLTAMYDRCSVEATWAQAHTVYIAFVTGRLSVHRDTSLARFPAIESYPATKESLRIAAAVRCAVSSLANILPTGDRAWPRYFWNRGLSLEPCDLTALHA